MTSDQLRARFRSHRTLFRSFRGAFRPSRVAFELLREAFKSLRTRFQSLQTACKWLRAAFRSLRTLFWLPQTAFKSLRTMLRSLRTAANHSVQRQDQSVQPQIALRHRSGRFAQRTIRLFSFARELNPLIIDLAAARKIPPSMGNNCSGW